MTVLGEHVQINVFNAMSSPACAYDDHCLLVDETNEIFYEQFNKQDEDNLEAALEDDLHTDVLVQDEETLPDNEEINLSMQETSPVEKKNNLELKELPAHLKYVLLGEKIHNPS